LDVPHHKNSKRWRGAAIKLELPAEVACLLDAHISWGHRLLTMCSDEVMPTLFVNTGTGAPLKAQELSKVWSKTVLEGTGLHFGPHMLRSIYVCGTKDQGLPIQPGMAMVMGSSQETIWERIYDKNFNNREVEAAMASMPAWRQAMLEKAKAARQVDVGNKGPLG
jgi:hypothetical protein